MRRAFKHVGWQVGVTYQTKDKEGLHKDYLKNLLKEMKSHGMNFISFMMLSYALNDPVHDGYAWPVSHPKAKCYIDTNCLNADPSREFLREIIEEAGNIGIHVNLFMNGFWWNPKRVCEGYPNICPIDYHGEFLTVQYYHHCSDNEDCLALARDEVTDLLGYYSHPALKSYGFEMIGRSHCTCPSTIKAFEEDTAKAKLEGKTSSGAREDLFRIWNIMRKKQVLDEYVLMIKTINPNIEIWHHGYMELIDNEGYRCLPRSYMQAGIDVAMPCIHSVTTEDGLISVLKSSDNFPVVLHVDTRDMPTENYNIPLKTPDDIRNMGAWIEDHHVDNLIGVVFFNEPATSRENKAAVYDVLEKWKTCGLVS